MHEPMPLPSSPSVPSVPLSQPVTFSGARRDFRKIAMRGAGLELVTLGFYRFWLATDMRRHLWSHTEVGGDHAEYTGTAKELLIGFLVALAILVPVYVAYFLAGLEAERLQAFASIPMFLFLYLFAQFALYRARRYRLSRTVWRGLRFAMGGSGWAYAWRAGLWGLLVMVTFGLALPWRNAALERFKMRNTRYGSLEGGFAATGGEFFRRGWWLWLITVIFGVLILPLPFIYAVYKAIEWRWWVSGLRFGAVRFSCDLDAAALMGLYWKVIGWLTLLVMLVSAWFGAVLVLGMALAGGTGATEQKVAMAVQHPLVLAALGFGYVAAALAFNVVIRIYLLRDVWARVAQTTRVHSLSAADDVTGEGDAVSALGEGFADSLDVAGF
jgi:uncharacterized membrane protein YjgN (DUF898 family)